MQGVDQKQPVTFKANSGIFAASLSCFFQVELSSFNDTGKVKTRLIYSFSFLKFK